MPPYNRLCLVGCATVLSLGFLPVQGQARKNVLAVFNLRATTIEAMGYSGDVLYTILSAMEKEKAIEVMPRREMEKILFQQGLAQGDNPEQVIKAGKVLGVSFILFGCVSKTDGQIKAELKLMDIPNKLVSKNWSLAFSGREAMQAQIPAFVKTLERAIATREILAPPKPVAEAKTEHIHVENLSATVQDEKVVLRWKFDPSQPIVAFKVYRSKDKDGPYQFLGRINKNIYTDAEIDKGEFYYYHLGIVLSSGQELESKQTTQIRYTGERVPYPPLIISGMGFIRRATLRFVPSLQNEQENFEITKYEVYRQVSGDDEWLSILTVDPKKSPRSKIAFLVEDSKIDTDGQTFIYAITSIDKSGQESPLSDPVKVQSISPPALSVGKDNLLRKVNLIWEAIKNVKGYNLYRKWGEEEWKEIGKIRDPTIHFFTDESGLEDGKTYQYYLTTYDDRGETSPSNEVQAKTKDLPDPPQNLRAKGGLVKSARLTWTTIDDPDIGGYYIYRGQDRKALEGIAEVKGYQSKTFLDEGEGSPLQDGQVYYYAVGSFNIFGAGGRLSKPISVTSKPRPTSVKGLTITKGEEDLTVQWDKNPEPDIADYIIYRSRNQGEWEQIRQVDVTRNTYLDKDLKPEDSYIYRIVAVDKDGLRGDPVESSSIQSPVRTLLVVDKDDLLRRVDFLWKPLRNIKGYYLYRRSDDEEWKRVGKISGADKSRYTDKKDLKDGKVYQYYLTTYDEEGETRPSNSVQAKTKDLPSPPEKLRAQGGMVKSVKVSWTPAEDTDIGGYAIYRGTSPNRLERIAQVKGNQSDSYLDKGKGLAPLEDGETYYYSVASYNLFKAEGDFSPAVQARTKPRPIAVTGLTAVTEQDRITVKWDKNPESDIRSYVLYRHRNGGRWSRIKVLLAGQNSYTDADLKPESFYQYRIVAEDIDGLRSDPVDSNSVRSPIAKSG